MPETPQMRLGRKPNTPDDRDWTPDKLHEHLGTDHSAPLPPPDQSLLDKPLRQLVEERNPFVTTWAGILALWKWIKSLLKPNPPTPPSPTPPTDGPLWQDSVLLNQGNFGTCVGNAWAGFLAALPVADPGIDETVARAIYYEATCIGGSCDDPNAPGGGQQGSSTRDGVKAIVARKRVSAYAFAAGTSDIDEWLDNHGPVVVGTDWYNDSFSTDSNGFINLTGGVAGGHEYILLQNLVSESAYLCQNSWGAWGINGTGRFKVRKTDMAKLQTDGGDACLAAELPL